MISRYVVQKPMSKERLRNFVALDNLTAQTPQVELVKQGRKQYVRIWTAYDYDFVCCTYTAVYHDCSVGTVTVYPGGRVASTTNRPKDR